MSHSFYGCSKPSKDDIKTKLISNTQIVNFEETQNSSRSKTITLPINLIDLSSVTVNTGSVSYSLVNGDTLTINVSSGSYTSSYYDSTKYYQYQTDYRTNSYDSFDSSVSYSYGGYSGSLSKNGNSYVTSGSYTPADYKTATDSRTSSTPGGTPTSVDYNSGGYSGTLTGGYESSTVISGSAYDTKSVTQTETFIIQMSNGSITDGSQVINAPTTIPYSDSYGYTGTLNSVNSDDLNTSRLQSAINSKYTGSLAIYGRYTGNVTKPDTRVYSYSRSYSGTVMKQAVDTRIYRQDYAGWAYMGGYDYYYSYNVTLKYITKIKRYKRRFALC